MKVRASSLTTQRFNSCNGDTIPIWTSTSSKLIESRRLALESIVANSLVRTVINIGDVPISAQLIGRSGPFRLAAGRFANGSSFTLSRTRRLGRSPTAASGLANSARPRNTRTPMHLTNTHPCSPAVNYPNPFADCWDSCWDESRGLRTGTCSMALNWWFGGPPGSRSRHLGIKSPLLFRMS
jgi:hypothetical protein